MKKERNVKIMTVKKKTLLLAFTIVVGIACIIAGAVRIARHDNNSQAKVEATPTNDAEVLKKIDEENKAKGNSEEPKTTTPTTTSKIESTTKTSESPTISPAATKKAEKENTETKKPEAEPTASPLKSSKRQFVVVIDPGHQSKQNSAQEAVAPGSSETKKKVSSGTQGSFTNVPEYEVNLSVSKKLKKELEKLGYKVIMTRETNDVDISNIERAQIANKAKADAFIRIHCDGSEDSSTNGIFTICPTKQNSYCKDIYEDCYQLSQCVLDGAIESTSANSRGIMKTDTMSGINWSEVPVTIIEMGFMSNKKEDKALATDSYQQSLATGIAKGIQKYLENK